MAITSAEAILWHTTPRKWLELPHLAGEPAEAAASIQARGAYAAAVGTDCAIQTVPGLINVIQYLDAHRAVVYARTLASICWRLVGLSCPTKSGG
jgi:hypothetical protein